ncbi:MAG: phosphate signaling complex protein PhoU [Acidimicrobiales bacterium]|nr:phosphate signaling complex protein PhoU [Acidimicrobiales bacterium]
MTEKRAFHQELDEIRAELVRMAAMVTEFIPRGTEALLASDLRAAQALIEEDDVVDELTVLVEDHCFQVLALQAPVATDLRALICALKLTSEIERSADLVINIVKAARRIYGAEFSPKLRRLIEEMSEEAVRLFRLSIDSYAEGDAALAAALDDMDGRLDTLHRDYIQAIFEEHDDQGLELQVAVQLALIGRYYERIGDHAVNIGNRVEFMVTGWLPEHTGAARHKARVEYAATQYGHLEVPVAPPVNGDGAVEG